MVGSATLNAERIKKITATTTSIPRKIAETTKIGKPKNTAFNPDLRSNVKIDATCKINVITRNAYVIQKLRLATSLSILPGLNITKIRRFNTANITAYIAPINMALVFFPLLIFHSPFYLSLVPHCEQNIAFGSTFALQFGQVTSTWILVPH